VSMTRVGERYSKFFCVPRFLLAELQDSTNGILVGDDHGFDDRLFDFLDVPGFGNFAGLSTSITSPVTRVMR